MAPTRIASPERTTGGAGAAAGVAAVAAAAGPGAAVVVAAAGPKAVAAAAARGAAAVVVAAAAVVGFPTPWRRPYPFPRTPVGEAVSATATHRPAAAADVDLNGAVEIGPLEGHAVSGQRREGGR